LGSFECQDVFPNVYVFLLFGSTTSTFSFVFLLHPICPSFLSLFKMCFQGFPTWIQIKFRPVLCKKTSNSSWSLPPSAQIAAASAGLWQTNKKSQIPENKKEKKITNAHEKCRTHALNSVFFLFFSPFSPYLQKNSCRFLCYPFLFFHSPISPQYKMLCDLFYYSIFLLLFRITI
jgi:hypothetical protein